MVSTRGYEPGGVRRRSGQSLKGRQGRLCWLIIEAPMSRYAYSPFCELNLGCAVWMRRRLIEREVCTTESR